MTGTAIAMMIVAMLVLWGGLTAAILHLVHSDRVTARQARSEG